MKEYAIQKQLIPIDQGSDPNWSKRQVWVYRINGQDQVDEFDTVVEAEAKRDELESNDPTARVYRVVRRLDTVNFEVVE